MHRCLRDEPGVEFVTFFPAVESNLRFVFSDFAHQRSRFAPADVGRIADDEVEQKWRVTSGEWRGKQNFVPMAFNKMEGSGYSGGLGVSLRAGESRRGN